MFTFPQVDGLIVSKGALANADPLRAQRQLLQHGHYLHNNANSTLNRYGSEVSAPSLPYSNRTLLTDSAGSSGRSRRSLEEEVYNEEEPEYETLPHEEEDQITLRSYAPLTMTVVPHASARPQLPLPPIPAPREYGSLRPFCGGGAGYKPSADRRKGNECSQSVLDNSVIAEKSRTPMAKPPRRSVPPDESVISAHGSLRFALKEDQSGQVAALRTRLLLLGADLGHETIL